MDRDLQKMKVGSLMFVCGFSFVCFLSFSRGKQSQAIEGGYIPELSSGGDPAINLEQLP